MSKYESVILDLIRQNPNCTVPFLSGQVAEHKDFKHLADSSRYQAVKEVVEDLAEQDAIEKSGTLGRAQCWRAVSGGKSAEPVSSPKQHTGGLAAVMRFAAVKLPAILGNFGGKKISLHTDPIIFEAVKRIGYTKSTNPDPSAIEWHWLPIQGIKDVCIGKDIPEWSPLQISYRDVTFVILVYAVDGDNGEQAVIPVPKGSYVTVA